MIVIDASATIEVLLSTSDAGRSIRRQMRLDPDLHAPHLIDAETAQAVRRFAYKGLIDEGRAAEAIRDLRDIRIVRHPCTHLLSRIWALHHNFSAYDATYVALAEALDAELLTCDERLATAVRDFTLVRLA